MSPYQRSTSPSSPTTTSADAPFADRVQRQRCGGAEVVFLPSPVRSVVTWQGSFLALPDMEAGDELLQELTVMMLDRGTRRRDRFSIAESLEDLGAHLEFESYGLRVRLSGKCLRKDVPDVLELMAEQLREPAFDAAELEKARAWLAADRRRQLENTTAQANTILAQRLYEPDHPNYDFGAADELRRLQDLGLEDVRAYYDAHFGASDLRLVFVGDVVDDEIAGAVERTLGDWPATESTPTYEGLSRPTTPGRDVIPMPDKSNVDVRMGHTLTLRRTDPDFIPLYIGNYILGGNFSARLMATVRDELGLTYGIHSSLSGFEREHDGHWQVSVTLSHDRVEEGIEATRSELDRFVRDGVTAEELAEKQTTIAGAYQVGLATTGGLASALLTSAERGFGPDYLDRFPEEVEGATVDQVNRLIRAYFDPKRLRVVLAGTRG